MTSGFPFGQKPPTTAGFGAQSAGGLNFSSMNTSSAPLQFGIGSNLQTTTSAPTSAPLQFALGQTATPSSGGFLLGSSATTSAPSLNFNPPFKSTGFTLGASPAVTTTIPGTLNFGLSAPFSTSTTTTSTSTTSASFNFLSGGTNTTQSTNFIGTPSISRSATPKLSFGVTTSTAPSTALSFGTSTGFNFGTTSVTTSTAPLSFGLGSSSLPSASLVPSSSTTSTVTTGLGGILTSDLKTKTTTTTTTTSTVQKEVPPKDQPLPNEIVQTVESFKTFVKGEKNHSSDVSRCSPREYVRVGAEMDIVINFLNELQYELQKNKTAVEKLKYDTAKGLQYTEMAQRTQDTPLGLQYENSAPMQFFIDLADNFEKEMHSLKAQLETIDKFMKNSQQRGSISSEDITLGMKRLHEIFIALAGRFQTVHSQVETQKEQFLNLRKKILNDKTDVFGDSSEEESDKQDTKYTSSFMPPGLSAGPTPFSSIRKSQAHFIAQTIPSPAIVAPAQNLSSSFSFTGPSITLPSTQQSGFQLNKPPVGNKRGKMLL